eukprot:scaffold421_cov382-Prasinococcus_capsulatus_cf.AAC.8
MSVFPGDAQSVEGTRAQALQTPSAPQGQLGGMRHRFRGGVAAQHRDGLLRAPLYKRVAPGLSSREEGSLQQVGHHPVGARLGANHSTRLSLAETQRNGLPGVVQALVPQPQPEDDSGVAALLLSLRGRVALARKGLQDAPGKAPAYYQLHLVRQRRARSCGFEGARQGLEGDTGGHLGRAMRGCRLAGGHVLGHGAWDEWR